MNIREEAEKIKRNLPIHETHDGEWIVNLIEQKIKEIIKKHDEEKRK